MVLLSVAWRNLWRHGRRTLITAAAMAVGIALALGLSAFSDGAGDKMFEVLVDEMLGHVEVHHPDYPAKRQMLDTIPGVSEKVAAIAAIPEVRALTVRLDAMGLLGGPEKVEGGSLIGIDPAREAAFSGIDTDVKDGRYLAAKDECVVGWKLAKKLEVKPGDELLVVTQASDGSIGNALFRIVGTVSTGNAMFDRSAAFADLSAVQDLVALPDQAHEILVLGPGREQVDQLFADVKAALGPNVTSTPPTKDAPAPDGALLVQRWMDASPQSASMLASYEGQSAILIVIVIALAALGVLNTMLMAVFERTYELGVLKSIGMRPRGIVWMVVCESVMLGGVSTAFGLVLGGLLVAYLTIYGIDFSAGGQSFDSMGVSFDMKMYARARLDRVVLVVVTVFVVSVLAALWPAVRAARLRPVEAMREDS